MWDQLRAREPRVLRQWPSAELSAPADGALTNTYITAGRMTPKRSCGTDSGVYANSRTDRPRAISFMAEAYLIEHGEITEPVAGSLIGNGLMYQQDRCSDDFAMGSPGTCGKDGQGVPVGDGTPTLRVTSLTVGGTAA